MNVQHDGDDTYLWDRSGTPDPEVVRLERVLGGLRYRGAAPVLPARLPQADARTRLQRFGAFAAAAAVVVAAAGAWFGAEVRRGAWAVTSVAGTPAVGGAAVAGRGRLSRGDWLETDAVSRARVAVGRIGTVDVEPNTRLQLIASGGREHRLGLQRGTIHARIWAPPRFFYVNTQAAVVVDLGCAYTLQVERDGSGLLRVTEGWVGFERDGRDTYVPEGAVCVTRADRGPGTPRYEDAPAGYGEALLVLDFGSAEDPRRAAALDRVLSTARRRDAITLWHLLARGTVEERSRVFERLVALAPPPDGVTRERVLRGDRAALNRWWDSLGLGDATWWRLFKKKSMR